MTSPASVSFTDLAHLQAAAPEVVCIVKKLALPLPKFEADNGGEALVYPATHSKAGEPITDPYNPALAAHGRGIILVNRGESVAAAPSDGNAIVIVNDVKAEDAKTITAHIDTQGGDPSKLTFAQFKDLLNVITALGYVDVYASDLGFHQGKLTANDELNTGIAGYSYGTRSDRVEGKKVQAVAFIPVATVFNGQAQAVDKAQTHQQGCLVVYDGGAPEGDRYRSIDTQMIGTYAFADGSPIKAADGSISSKVARFTPA